GKHLVTIGLFSPDHISKVEPFVDFISFHHYEDPQQLERTISDIQELTGKPIVLEEIGLHTWINRPGDPHNEYDQRRYLEESLKIIKRRDIAGLLFWTLIDYPVGVTFEEVETHNNHMGVFRTDYTWKPSASIIRTFSFQ
ncbi:MAG: hypothetical protein GTN80_01155, partial [Nitrososphaeria archaeon]|nr:hypothetical protein [Nitrososphaeria archaeon]NIN51755.1 hypothetical protein [Nitrososphaeria archaeon]NIQ32253.1 hypothetical protein [Nitrososphaeria archaeon]